MNKKSYDVIVLGFGKAGKTLAAKLGGAGKQVAMIEESPTMYGGTCINIACIPTKTMIVAAHKGLSYAEVQEARETVTTRLRGKNFSMLDTNPHVDVYTAHGEFVNNHEIKLVGGTDELILTAPTIIINTGATPIKPTIPGIDTAEFVYNSTELQQLQDRPNRLGVVGAGPIGLEFANLYATLGSRVTLFNLDDAILSHEEPTIQRLGTEYIEQNGVAIINNAHYENIKNNHNAVVLAVNGKDYEFDAILYATGRKPNTQHIGLENTDITTNDRGAIVVNDYCESSVPGIYAVGDVNGGPQFTYVSLDDFRIVLGHLTGTGQYTLKDRKNVPHTTFITPPLSRVGLTEAEATAKGYVVKTNEILAATMPRSHVNNDLRGAFKIVVNAENDRILGATLFSQGSEELINLIKMAMDNDIPYTYFKTQIFTHPTMAENLNDLYNF